MNRTELHYRNLLNQLSLPIIYLSSFAAIAALFGLTNNGVLILASFMFPYFIVYSITKSQKKGIISGFCVCSGNLVYLSLTDNCFSLVIILLLSVAAFLIIKDIRMSYAFVSLFVSFSLVGAVAGLAYPVCIETLKHFAPYLRGKGFAFGAVKNLYDLAISEKLSELFYNTSFSQTELINGKIISGAIAIFKLNSLSRVVSTYLTGQYFVSIFLTIGTVLALYQNIHGETKLAFVSSGISALVSGDVRLFGLFILLYNPLVFTAYILVCAVSYLVSELLKLCIGFEEYPSVIELFKNGNSWGYFLITGTVLSFLIYFLSRMIMSKFELSRGRYYPRDIKRIVYYLGGKRNIEKTENGKVTVHNPNLVNILSLDCDIHGNVVLLNEDIYSLIEEYFI